VKGAVRLIKSDGLGVVPDGLVDVPDRLIVFVGESGAAALEQMLAAFEVIQSIVPLEQAALCQVR
jgi:hypothetical protein